MQFFDDIPGKPAPPDPAITAWYDEMVRTGRVETFGIHLNWTHDDLLAVIGRTK